MKLFPNAQDLSQTNAGALGVVSGNVAGNPPYLAGNHRKYARFEIYASHSAHVATVIVDFSFTVFKLSTSLLLAAVAGLYAPWQRV